MHLAWQPNLAGGTALTIWHQLLERPIDGDSVSLDADDCAVGMARIRPQPVDPFEIDHDRAERLRLVAAEDDLIAAKKRGYLISPAYEITAFACLGRCRAR